MIVRKPYAFLIKNFKKIHIFMLILCAYVYYKTLYLSSFVKEFIQLSSYDSVNEPIGNYINFLSYFFMFLILLSSIAIMILLKHKKKPWKTYILPIAEYFVLFIVFGMIANFFNTYDGNLSTAGIRALSDTLVILELGQYAIFILLIIRIFGVDLNKFDFKSDEEYLQLSEEDRDEIEININIDKESFKRTLKRIKRNIGYFIKEHKKIVATISIVLITILSYKTYKFIFITNKAYKEGQTIETSGYTIKINKSYYTDKDYKGDIIEEGYGFIVLDLKVTNNVKARTINLNRFHIINGTSNYSHTERVYGTQFQDLGKTYEKKNLRSGDTLNMIMIYRVKKGERINRYVLYYQEFNNDNTNHLRKIKLKVDDVSKIEKEEPADLGDVITLNMKNDEQELIFDNVSIGKETTYLKRICEDYECTNIETQAIAKDGYQIMKIDYASNDFDDKDMIDFLTKYGKISYIDSKNKVQDVKVQNGIGTENYSGKYVYLQIPDEAVSKKISLNITVRNKQYVYNLTKGE